MESTCGPDWLAQYFYMAGLILLVLSLLAALCYDIYYYYVFYYSKNLAVSAALAFMCHYASLKAPHVDLPHLQPPDYHLQQ